MDHDEFIELRRASQARERARLERRHTHYRAVIRALWTIGAVALVIIIFGVLFR